MEHNRMIIIEIFRISVYENKNAYMRRNAVPKFISNHANRNNFLGYKNCTKHILFFNLAISVHGSTMKII